MNATILEPVLNDESDTPVIADQPGATELPGDFSIKITITFPRKSTIKVRGITLREFSETFNLSREQAAKAAELFLNLADGK